MQLLKPKKQNKIKTAASNLGNTALAGAGTGSLAALLKYPEDGKMQRRGAYIGAGLAVGHSLAKSAMNKLKRPKKPKKVM